MNYMRYGGGYLAVPKMDIVGPMFRDYMDCEFDSLMRHLEMDIKTNAEYWRQLADQNAAAVEYRAAVYAYFEQQGAVEIEPLGKLRRWRWYFAGGSWVGTPDILAAVIRACGRTQQATNLIIARNNVVFRELESRAREIAERSTAPSPSAQDDGSVTHGN